MSRLYMHRFHEVRFQCICHFSVTVSEIVKQRLEHTARLCGTGQDPRALGKADPFSPADTWAIGNTQTNYPSGLSILQISDIVRKTNT